MRIILERDVIDESGGYGDKKTVSDWVTPEEVSTWEQGDIITITANTGVGKSYFVKHTLLAYLKEQRLRCLYLVSRTRTKEQFEVDLSGEDAINFMTYQAVETIMSNPDLALKNWDVIVADECHYFIADSDFNYRTDISFDWILGQAQAIRVFMTATFDGIERYFYEQGIQHTGYVIPIDNRKISSLTFFWKEEQVQDIAHRIVEAGNKGVIFLQSAAKAYNLHCLFKDDSLFLCSTHNKDYSKYMNKEAIAKMIETERFECSLLITTQALDTGVNLKDQAITDIITDVSDPASIIQCVGRKRFLSEDDTINLYIHALTNQQIGGLLNKLKRQREVMKDFFEKGATAFNAFNNRGNGDSGLVYDAPETEAEQTLFSKQINKLKYARLRQKIAMYEDMLKLGSNGFIEYVFKLFHIKDYSIIESEQKKQSIAEYLNLLVNKPLLTKQEKDVFIQKMDIRQNRKLSRSFESLEGWLKGSRLPYRLVKFRTSRIEDGKQKFYTAWEVVMYQD